MLTAAGPPAGPPAAQPAGPPAEAIVRAKGVLLDDLTTWSPALVRPGSRLLDRISTRNWALEWGLPYWIASAYGLPEPAAFEQLVCSVYLLAYARLVDDLADQEAPEPVGEAVVLAASLQHLWTRLYVRMFDGPTASAFWSSFDECGARWLRATLPSADAGSAPPAEADRGALLHVACVSGCLAAGRGDVVATLVAALEDLLTGIVLLDDAFDWSGDLEAGRHNALVAVCSPLPQTAEHRAANRTAVLRGVYVDDVLTCYFGEARRRLGSALARCEQARCPGLGGFVAWYAAEVDASAQWMRARARDRLLAWATAPNAGGR